MPTSGLWRVTLAPMLQYAWNLLILIKSIATYLVGTPDLVQLIVVQSLQVTDTDAEEGAEPTFQLLDASDYWEVRLI